MGQQPEPAAGRRHLHHRELGPDQGAGLGPAVERRTRLDGRSCPAVVVLAARLPVAVRIDDQVERGNRPYYRELRPVQSRVRLGRVERLGIARRPGT